MSVRKFLKYTLLVLVFISFIIGNASQTQPGAAMPMSPTDESKVPHYFGPYPNWANSPFTLPDVSVNIDPPPAGGTQALATATVGGNGVITGITITDPGSGYTSIPLVNITGAGTGAAANAVINLSGVVTSIRVDTAGAGYTAPSVTIGGGGPAFIAPTVSPVLTNSYRVSVGSATGGTFLLLADAATTAPILWNASALDVQTALGFAGVPVTVTGSGSIADPWVVTFVTLPASFTLDGAALNQGVLDAAVTATLDPLIFNATAGSATGGTFLLTVDGLTTAPLLWNVSALDVETALGLAGVTATVTGTGTIADPWVITFAVAPTTVTMDSALLTQGVADTLVAAVAASIYRVDVGSAIGGTFLLTVDVTSVGPIAWNALAADVQNALLLAGFTAGVTGSGSIADPWVITFTTAPLSVAIDGTALVQPAFSGATATAYGGVDLLTLVDAGSGYSFPTVDFDMPNDPNGTQASGHVVCVETGCIPNAGATTVTISGVVIDQPGSGYSAAPHVVIRDGTLFDPVNHDPGTFFEAIATATLTIQSITVDTFGSGYTSAPAVVIADAVGIGSGASATAFTDFGAVTAINLTAPGSGYTTTGGIKKFQDGLPVLCDPTAGWANCTDNNLGQHIPIAVPDTTTFTIANGFTADADYYVIAVVQNRERMSSSLPLTGTLLREYVQLETPANASFSKHIALQTALLDGTFTPTLMPDGSQAYAVDDPHFLGPVIVANKNKPVRIVFYNLLPTGSEGDLFLPTDSTIMGSGMGPMAMPDPIDTGTVTDTVRNPMCGEYPKDSATCFKDTRATLHLHGGTTPWISDGTAHQWITPANEATMWPQGVDVAQVPDMVGASIPAGVPDCSANGDGCMTFYYTNQQSARLMFYHDHAWGITRLNVYAGEAAGYVITDATEAALLAPGGAMAGLGVGTPLVIQDRTFVPDAAQLAAADPTWDSTRWGGYGNLWYHHVYMPAQNPGDPGGMSGYGRWMYGPWFWPPATPMHGPIANPYYNMDPLGPDGIRGTIDDFTTQLAVPCNIDDPATWQYDTDPFCEPQLIPGTPNISVGMEQFNDTPLVNGTAYPTTTVDPKSYRFRILNAANDRFWNLQWYIADPRTGTLSEVALNPADLAAAQLDPTVSPNAIQSYVDPTTGLTVNLAGPDWIVIGSEGGFLPAPVVVDGQQVTTWIMDPTRFDVGNVDKHSLLLAPAERADVIVDFSRFAGQTLILYNDAPAAFPARVPSYDYYTGAPDQSPVGAANILPGYGPNTRTIMQVVVSNTPAAPAFNLTALRAAFRHHADGSGVFESGQHPIIVGQAAYNSAYGTSFAASSWCNAPGSPITRCDGFARISDQGGDLFGFNTLRAPNAKMQIPLQPKAIHDEMNAVAFDEFGRMTANIGLEVVPATPAGQNIVLYPFVNPSTELIDATNLPKLDQYGIGVTPISSAADGTQIWKITHNGVDTHPIHFHLYDVQVLNRVTWDNIIIPNDPTELGWKDTVRISPLQDTIVALRPIIPYVPFELPNSIRMLNPMMPAGSEAMFNNVDANGNPTAPIVNQLVNFGWQYVYHCHILSHEEMDMMRPVSVAIPPIAPDGLAYTISGAGNNMVLTLTWNDKSINETSFVVQRDAGAGYVDIGTLLSPLDQPNIHELRTFADTTYNKNVSYSYRVVAKNTIGYGGDYMGMTVQSVSAPVVVIPAPTGLILSLRAGPMVGLSWMDNSTNETGFAIQRSTDGVTFAPLATAPAHNNIGLTSYNDATVVLGTTYFYRVAAVNTLGSSIYSNIASISVTVPAAPSNLTASGVRQGANERVTFNWTDNSTNEVNFIIQRATNAAFTTGLATYTANANTTTFTTGNMPRFAYYFRIRAVNVLGTSAWVNATPFPLPPAP